MKLFAMGAFALASLAAGSAAAQAQAPTNPGGPVIAGVCVVHNDRLLAQSTAGQSLIAGMQRLEQEVVGELAPYQQSIQSEVQALQQGGASIPADQRQLREQQTQQRYQELQQLGQVRQSELQYTQAMQVQTINRAAAPILQTVYQERGCGIMLDRSAAYLFNSGMDVTDLIIQRLNTALPTLSFNRLPVPAQLQQ